MISKRGKPDNNSSIHYMLTVQERMDRVAGYYEYKDVSCSNGSFHVLHTRNKSEVTCTKCLSSIKEAI